MGITPIGLVPLVTYDCNATCTHCFFRRDKNSPALSARILVDAVASLRDPLRWIHFSGGEPLLDTAHFYSLLDAITPLHRGSIGLDSNGSWGQTPDQAQRTVAELKQRGVTSLYLSADSFHQPTIPADHVVHAGRAIREAQLPEPSCLVAVIAHAACRDAEVLNYATRALMQHLTTATGLPVAETPMRLLGRATRLPRSMDSTADLPDGPCGDLGCCVDETAGLDAPQMVWLDPMGNVMICPGITIGSLHTDSLQDILDRYDPQNDPVLCALSHNGPQGLYHLAKLHHVAPSGPFIDRCDVCFQSRRTLQEIYPQTLTPAVCYPSPLVLPETP